MPIVRQPVPQVQDQPFTGQRPSVRATPDAFGDALGQGAAVASQQFARAYERERIAADEVAVLEADREFAQWENDNLYDPVKGALMVRGKDAMGLPDTVGQSMRKALEGIEGRLGNDQQRRGFKRLAGRRQIDVERRIYTHVAAQVEQFDDAETEALVTLSQAAAAANYDNPARVALEFARQDAAVAAWANRKGLPMDSEVVADRLAGVRDSTHSGVVGSLLTNEMYAEARDYLEANEEELSDPEVKARLKSAVRAGGLREESQQSEDSIMRKHAGNESAALAAARQERPDIRDDVVARVAGRFSESRRIRDQGDTERGRYVQQQIRAGARFTDLPVNVVSAMTAEQIATAKATEEWVRTGMPALDSRKFAELERLRGNDPAKFMALNLDEYQPFLEPSMYRAFVNQQSDMKLAAAKGDSTADTKVTATQTFNQQFNELAKQSGLISGDQQIAKLKGDKLDRYVEVKTEAMKRLEAWEVTNGRKATPVEQRQILANLMLQRVSVERDWMWDRTDVPAAMVEQDQYGRTYVPESSMKPEFKQQLLGLVMNTRFKNIPDEQMTPEQRRERKNIMQNLAAAIYLRDRDRVETLLGGPAAARQVLEEAGLR